MSGFWQKWRFMCCARIRAGGRRFTLVEMLVVIAIIAILASLLMPSLVKAIDSARKMACANNLRNLNTATQVYLDDNSQILMSTEDRNYPTGGWVNSFSDFKNWYAGYLDAPQNPENPANISGAIRFYTAAVTICPSRDPLQMATGNDRSAGRIYNLPRLTYGMFAFSAADRPISLVRLIGVFNRNKHSTSGTSPAMWADKCQRESLAGFGGFDETNHKFAYTGSSSGIPEGGNVSHADGHVKWFGFVTGDYAENSYVINGAVVGGATPLPASALFPFCTVGGVLHPTSRYWILGRKYFSFQ